MNTTATEPTRRQAGRTRNIIWDAITDLHAQEQVITREVLRDVTGLKMMLIDDHLKKFIDEDEIGTFANFDAAAICYFHSGCGICANELDALIQRHDIILSQLKCGVEHGSRAR